MTAKLSQLVGDESKYTEVIMIFRVEGKYYPATDHNCRLYENYMHTGDNKFLEQLEHEMEV